jgi:hypothetical protein
VASCSDQASLRTWNKKKHYSEWEFLGVGFNPGGMGASPTPGNPQTGQGQANGQTQGTGGTGSIFGSSPQNPTPGNPLSGQGQGPGTNQNQNLGQGTPDQPQNPPEQQQPPDQIQPPEQPVEEPPDQNPPDQNPPDQPPPGAHAPL